MHRKSMSSTLSYIALVPALVACSDATAAAERPTASSTAGASREAAAAPAERVADTPVALKRAMLTITGMK